MPGGGGVNNSSPDICPGELEIGNGDQLKMLFIG